MKVVFLSIALALGAASAGCLGHTSVRSSVQARSNAKEARAASSASSAEHPSESGMARNILCADIGEDDCRRACPESAPWRDHVDCLLGYRFGEDPEALALARSLFERTSVLLGVEGQSSLEGYPGNQIGVRPALPLGRYRHHLVWLIESLDGLSSFVDALSTHAPRAVHFRPLPHAFRFYRTEGPSYPSAYGAGGVIGYNVEGPLHTNARDARETLIHEIFHLNDEWKGAWSNAALANVFESIVARCGDDHACFATFAPHDTVVPGGTYYGFDERTRDVREYAAELALRFIREHEAILGGRVPIDPPFKCLAEENFIAWTLLADAFFGGADLSPRCAA